MTIELEIKDKLKDVKLDKWKRVFYKVILGEFNRVDDGKLCTQQQCLTVIKKLIKSGEEMFKHKPDPLVERELKFLETFLPKQADESTMKKVIISVLSSNEFKNKMQAMKPCIDILDKMGVDVNKGILSKLLKESR